MCGERLVMVGVCVCERTQHFVHWYPPQNPEPSISEFAYIRVSNIDVVPPLHSHICFAEDALGDVDQVGICIECLRYVLKTARRACVFASAAKRVMIVLRQRRPQVSCSSSLLFTRRARRGQGVRMLRILPRVFLASRCDPVRCAFDVTSQARCPDLMEYNAM